MLIKKNTIKKGIIIPFLLVFLMSQNTFAVTKDYAGFKLRLRYQNQSSYILSDTLLYGEEVNHVDKVDGVRVEVNTVGTVPSNTSHIVVTGKLNLVVRCRTMIITGDLDTLANNYCPHNTASSPQVYAVNVNGSSVSFTSASINTYITNWRTYLSNPAVNDLNRTFTFEYSFIINNGIPSTINTLAFFFDYDGSLDNANYDNYTYYFEGDVNNHMIIDYTTDNNTALLQQQIQLQQSILDSLNDLSSSSSVDNSVQNIQNQTSSDIPNATNSQTTSLINTLTSFVGAITAIDTTGNCQLTLPFPNFAGGSFTVNPCNGADKAPTIIQVFSSLFLIGIFVPLAWLLLKMIYNEIRSWTNG